MRTWYLIRGGNQTGPFSAHDLLSMLQQGTLYPQDVFVEAPGGKRYTIEKAIKRWRKTAQRRPKKKPTGLIVFLSIVLLIGGFITYKILTKKSDNLTLGTSIYVVTEHVSSGGGVVTVTGGNLDGFVIDVPEGAYTSGTSFEVSERPIEDHKFGPLFTPASPLITIDNGNVFSDEAVTVTIPIEKTDDEFAMGFYYDEKTGALEGIPLISLDNNQITLLTNHFCEIVVSKVALTELEGLDVVTGFVPGVDDWQFTNYGSYISVGGHCAGQSITAMWYFDQMYQRLQAPRLYGLFDNYGYDMTTSTFWRDDSEAYRFASVIQTKLNWDSKLRIEQRKLSRAHPIWTMNAFIYSMKMTDHPQYLAITGEVTNANGTKSPAGHAIIAYAIEGNTIYVCDPNYPGSTGRTITFNGSGFQTYSSGLNAADIAAGKDIAFTGIYYVAQTAMIDHSTIKAEYDKMIKATVGDDQFPICTYSYVKSIDEDGNTEWADMPAELALNSADNIKNLGEAYKDQIRIAIETSYSGVGVALYDGLNGASVTDSTTTDNTGLAYFTIDLKPGINDVGLYLYLIKNITATQKTDKFIEFQRFRIDFDQTVDMKFDKNPYTVVCQNESTFSVTVKDAPADVTYVWDFGDGSTAETDVPQVNYTYTKQRDYDISCTLKNNIDGKVLGEARAQVGARDLYGVWNFSYRITESKAADSLINMIVELLVTFFQQIFPNADFDDSYDFSLKGTVVSGQLYVIQSADDVAEDFQAAVELHQQRSSNDLVDVDDTPLAGYIIIDGDTVEIHIIADPDSADMVSGMVFKGELNNKYMSGNFSASGLMRGTFVARK